MKHQMTNNRLGKAPKELMAMLRNMASSLFMHEAIKTTVPRAKEIKRFAEKIITNAKHGNYVEVKRKLYEDKVAVKVMYELAPRYAAREGGYTRILKCGFRKGDAAEMAMIELVDRGAGEIRPKQKFPMPPSQQGRQV
ncbi:ribosomal protein L17 [Batrachochytrium salamandrivorans]|nr:ribosomal protein L17 [Batrachochytrium salamandrivorans]